ncbi:MAG: ABC transporter permease [Proteobacteria bacterium]|nr:ABC transporter permease [Pseudomonadota bacterium]MCP4919827.1 ABC transporter permease [Pseudomonadota bacterium]
MVWFLNLALRNVFRNTRRSLLTAATVFFGTAVLTIGLSWITGVLGGVIDNIAANAGEIRVVTPEFEAREQLMPLHLNIVDSAPVVEAIEAEGMRAWPLIRTGATATVGEEIGEVFCQVVGAPTDWMVTALELDTKLADGRFIEAELGETVIGTALAEDLGAVVGDELVLLGQTQDGSISPVKADIVGIVDTGNIVGNRQAFLSIEQMRWMADMDGGAVEIMVQSDADVGDARLTAESLRTVPGLEGLTVQAWNERDPYGAIYDINKAILYVLAGAIVFITALGVLNTMMMSVLERTGEIGVLRAMGMKTGTVVSMFVLEAWCIGTLGSLLGVLVGSGPAWLLETNGIELGADVASKVTMPVNTTFYGDLSIEIVGLSFVLGMAIAVLGAFIPSLRATAIEPVDAMRSRR